MRNLLLSALLLAPVTAFAAGPECKFSEPRDLKLDLAGVKTVVFEVNQHDLRIDASSGAGASLQGRACANNADWLKQLTVSQQKAGDKLVVRLQREGKNSGIYLGSNYAYLKMAGTLPDNVMVQLDVGSGDAVVNGAAALSADVGSGDVEARRIRGSVTAKVGSGDLEFNDIGSLHVLAVGSGDARASQVRGTVKVGSIGSGDFELKDAQGKVDIGSVGSGDADVSGARNGVEFGSIGSGSVDIQNVDGDVVVGSISSGDLEVRDVRGNLTVRSVGSGDIRHSGVSGSVNLPKKR